jgi:hypothetical protein
MKFITIELTVQIFKEMIVSKNISNVLRNLLQNQKKNISLIKQIKD